jgi:hypothetical protein
VNDIITYCGNNAIAVPAVGGYGSSYDLTQPEGRRLQYRACVFAEFQLDRLVGQTIQVEHIVVHWVPETVEGEQTGELRPRIVLVQPDGTRISTSSLPVLRQLAQLVDQTRLSPPWLPPLKFLVRHVPLAGKTGHWILLEWEG